MLRHHSLTLLLVTICGIMIAGAGWAADFEDILAQVLKAKIDSGESSMVVNPLSDIEFDEGHIPGSVNIPLHLISTTDRLPAEKSTLIVTYCL